MSLQIELSEAVNLLMSDRGGLLLDLYEIVALLEEQFPSLSKIELAQSVARQAVADGALPVLGEAASVTCRERGCSRIGVRASLCG